MRIRIGLIALFIGSVALLALAPETVRACDRYGGPVYYVYQPAPVYYPPMYSQPRVYYAPMYYQPRASYAPPMYYSQPYTPQASPAKPTTIINIGAGDNFFDPGTVNVQPGTTVKWVNKGQHKHTVTSDNGKWDSGDLTPGATYSVTFNTPGTYYYHCHHHKGMKGTIVVGSSGRTTGKSGY